MRSTADRTLERYANFRRCNGLNALTPCPPLPERERGDSTARLCRPNAEKRDRRTHVLSAYEPARGQVWGWGSGRLRRPERFLGGFGCFAAKTTQKLRFGAQPQDVASALGNLTGLEQRPVCHPDRSRRRSGGVLRKLVVSRAYAMRRFLRCTRCARFGRHDTAFLTLLKPWAT
jgi:hypothetical protein